MILSFLSVFCHVYLLASLLQPTETLNITLHFTRQIQDEISLHKNKIAAATREADNEHLRGNTVIGSFRFIRNDVQATIQTALNATGLVIRVFILLSILLITTLVDGFKFCRHFIDSMFNSLANKKKKWKKIKYLARHRSSLATLVVGSGSSENSSDDIETNETVNNFNIIDDATSEMDYENEPLRSEFKNSAAAATSTATDEATVPSSSRPNSDDLTWFKTLFPSCTTITTKNNNESSLATPDLNSSTSTPTTLSNMGTKNGWNENADESDMSHLHTTTLFIDNSNKSNEKNINKLNEISPRSLSLSVSSSSASSSSASSSKASLTTIATNKSRFSIRKKRQSSSAVQKEPSSSPPRPLATYSSRPFTTSNALITVSQVPSPLGSSLSLKLKQPGRRLSLLFRKKKKQT